MCNLHSTENGVNPFSAARLSLIELLFVKGLILLMHFHVLISMFSLTVFCPKQLLS